MTDFRTRKDGRKYPVSGSSKQYRKSYSQPRVVLGQKKGTKCRIRYPSQSGGYIQYTCASLAEAERQKESLGGWQKRRAKITKV